MSLATAGQLSAAKMLTPQGLETLRDLDGELEAKIAKGAPHTTHAAEAAPSSVAATLGLSPDSLMAYCQSRLNSLDDQMSGIFNTQTQNAQETKDVNAIAAALDDLPGPSSGSSNIPVGSTDQANITSAYNVAIADASQTNKPLAAQLENDLAAFNTDAKGGSMNPDTITQLSQNCKNYAGTLNSDSELTMINLQSLMSQRQTAVQLTTNLVQSLGEQTSDIAKNVGT
jgi:hypothetical protein